MHLTIYRGYFFKITQNKSSKKLQQKYFENVVTGVSIQSCYPCYQYSLLWFRLLIKLNIRYEFQYNNLFNEYDILSAKYVFNVYILNQRRCD